MAIRMASWAPKPEILRAISPDAIDAFLARRGWVRKPSVISLMRYYEHSTMFFDDGKRMYYYFPDIDTSAEYPSCVREFIENQAQFWELDPRAILTELQGGPLAEPVRTTVPA